MRITWTRVGDLVVVALFGNTFVHPRDFEPFLAALYELPPRKVLLGAFGSPAFDAEQRRRFHAVAASLDVSIALVFDGSLVTRSVGVALSRSLPKLAIFHSEELEFALDHLSIAGAERDDAMDVFRLLAFGAR